MRVAVNTETHCGTPDAAHVQPDGVETEKLLVVPVEVAETVAGVTVNVQVPRCVTVNVRPPIATVPVRCAVALLTATPRLTLPFPFWRCPGILPARSLIGFSGSGCSSQCARANGKR